jgi:membrane-bound metal-dependent hydrolase YbcI (DUF457 family)
MGLKKNFARWRYKYGWRLRHWWFDTREGAQARVLAWCVGVLVAIVMLVRHVVAGMAPPAPVDPLHPQQAIIVAVVILIVALIVGLAVALTMNNNSPQVPEGNANTPTTEDGQSVRHHFGTVWEDDTFLLAWKIVGKDPIKADGGK